MTTVVAVVVPEVLLMLLVETAVVLPIDAVLTAVVLPIEAVEVEIPVTAVTEGPLNPAVENTLPTMRAGPVTKRSFKLAIGHQLLLYLKIEIIIISKASLYINKKGQSYLT